MEESCLSTVHLSTRILAPKGQKQVGSITSGERVQNITLISARNAMGHTVPPLFIFPRLHFKDYILKGAPNGIVGMANPRQIHAIKSRKYMSSDS